MLQNRVDCASGLVMHVCTYKTPFIEQYRGAETIRTAGALTSSEVSSIEAICRLQAAV